eukprot:6180569-Pleurochrysis_carterae.AAC.6
MSSKLVGGKSLGAQSAFIRRDSIPSAHWRHSWREDKHEKQHPFQIRGHATPQITGSMLMHAPSASLSLCFA